ncbi:MAG: hypothetical protein JSU83_17095 [Deltaproteobacteria bacterium]|nr:MAG: hypothetical protein JSU83_17095 [Deltaproteobacteria bacterium]
MQPKPAEEIACCEPSYGPQSSPYERSGYRLCLFVEDFVQTPVRPVPKVKTDLSSIDIFGTIKTRLNISRMNYKVAPGLYCVGNPNPKSPVLVTANYKLTFDVLRKQLSGLDVWILVLDTQGINVWCSAGKRIFSTEEVVRSVRHSCLDQVVAHRKLILPQLSATGVSAQQVKKGCGFEVVWGPVRANDIKPFLDNGMKAEPEMRQVTFSFRERVVLIPVELTQILKPLLWLIVIAFLLSGIGWDVFSIKAAWLRGLMLIAAAVTGIISGAVLAPAFLPWIPTRTFALKGGITGLITGAGIVWLLWEKLDGWGALGLIFCTLAISSYMAMNFTGSTPFTSMSGVEKEMRKAIPLQMIAGLMAVVVWVGSAFAR